MDLEALQIGLVVWAEADPKTTLHHLHSFGLRAGQLGVPPTMDCGPATLAAWQTALAETPTTFSTAVCAYAGEDYADLEAVHRTVGFTAPGYASARIARTKEVSAFAAKLNIPAVSCHIGFIPSDPSSPVYTELLTIARDLADTCAAHSQSFVLETGQESAATLLAFLNVAGRPNLRVNFDPANMILYGSGDPIQALTLLRERVLSVHCKDGLSPTAPGTLGLECPLGDGEVDLPAFLATLGAIGYKGLLTIEREEPNVAKREVDIRLAIARLNALQRPPA